MYKYYVALISLISKAYKLQCGLKASRQPPMNLDTQIKFLILKSFEWWVSKSKTPELSSAQSLLIRFNPKDTDQLKHMVSFFLQKTLNIIGSTPKTFTLS